MEPATASRPPAPAQAAATGAPPVPGTGGAPAAGRSRAARLLRTHPLELVTLLGYALLVLAGATTSSIGVGHLLQGPDEAGPTQWGEPRWIRSDEYNVFTPIDLSIMATGEAPTLSPLGVPAELVHRYPTDGFFGTVTFFDATLLRLGTVLPDAQLYAAHWWLPVLLLLVFLPRWFEQVGHSRRAGWLAAPLIVLSPSVAWWSLQPVQQMAYTVTGCSLLLSCATRLRRPGGGDRALGIVLGVVGGILLAGMPSGYVGWSLLLGLPVLLATTLHLLTRPVPWRQRLLPLVVTGGTALVFAVGTLLENWDSVQALLGTVYPGQRRATSDAQPAALLLGAPGLGALQHSVVPDQLNASELSTSFTVAFAWAAVLLAARPAGRAWRADVVTAVIGVSGLLWLVWCTVDLGDPSGNLPIFNRVPAIRAAQVVGILGVLLVALLLPRVRDVRWGPVLAAGVACGLLTGYGVSLLRDGYLPTVPTVTVVLAAAAVAAVAVTVTRYPDRWWPVALAVVLAAVPVYRANPVLFGLADLRGSQTAEYFAEQGREARESGSLWVSDSTPVDVVMLANGVPTLSGFQRSGPDAATWERLDPENRFEEAWNRGGGYVPFGFAEGQPVEITTNGFDVTHVRVDPCELAATFQDLSHVASRQPLTATCLAPQETLTWSGEPVHVYQVVR